MNGYKIDTPGAKTLYPSISVLNLCCTLKAASFKDDKTDLDNRQAR